MSNHLTTAERLKLHRDGQLPAINLLFFWQGPYHCKNAYIKEFARKNYPDEYRAGVPVFEPRNPIKGRESH